MSITWILVANASAAYLYANYGPKKGLQKLKEFRHDASREKRVDLVSDRPGHNRNNGNGRGSYVPPPIQNNMKLRILPAALHANLSTDAPPTVTTA